MAPYADAEPGFAGLQDIKIPAGGTAWAVGSGEAGARTVTLALHWQGGKWVKTPSPTPGGQYGGALLGVAGSGPNDVWSVGYFTGKGGKTHPLIEHWNGTKWRARASAPIAHSPQSALEKVVAFSPTNAWAVGYSYVGQKLQSQTLIEHWNGTTWVRVASPNPPGPVRAGLYGISAASPSNITAVGSYEKKGGTYATISEHWNGTKWTMRKTPSPQGPGGSYLLGSATTTATEGWAVGETGVLTLALRWNGTSWSRTPSPSIGSIGSILTDVRSLSGANAWAVGTHSISLAASRPLVEHWNGTKWVIAQR